MHLRVSDEDNLFLTAVFIEEEVLEAIYSCETLKSLGPDGFNFGFLKNFRGLYKDDLLRCLDEFYDHGKLVKGLNSSFIVLIPKKKKAVNLGAIALFLWWEVSIRSSQRCYLGG